MKKCSKNLVVLMIVLMAICLLPLKIVFGETTSGLPIVKTIASANIINSGALLSGDIETDGGSEIIERGFAYSINTNPTIEIGKKVVLGATGVQLTNLTGLTGNTKYYYRAYATNLNGTSYGEEKSFTTLKDDGFVSVSANGNHTVALNGIGNVYTWGSNCDGKIRNSGSPIQLKSLDGIRIVSISEGGYHTLALSDNGDVYAWGENYYGQLGLGATDKIVKVPTRITALNGIKIVALSAGEFHTVALTEDGKVYSWGYNEHGQLGNGQTKVNSMIPIKVSNLSDVKIVSIVAAKFYSVAITQDGKVYGWGSLGNMGGYGPTPTLINCFSGLKVVSLASGDRHSIILTDDGKVYSVGNNDYGQLGNGTFESSNTPVEVTAFNNSKVTEIAAGYFHSIVLTEKGDAYLWGSDYYGNSYNLQRCIKSPVLVKGLDREKIMSVTSGYYFNVLLSEAGKIYTVGCNMEGSLGNEGGNDYTPIQVDTLFNKKILSIAAGPRQTVAVSKDGKVYEWKNSNLDYSKRMPVSVKGLNDTKIVSVSVGNQYSIALSQEGKVYSWGVNRYGQLGNGTLDNSNIPVKVSGLENIKIISVSAGDSHVVALSEDGKVYAWGI